MSLMSVAPAADTSVPVFCRVGEGCRLASSGGHPRRPMRDSRRAFVAIWEALHGRAPALALPSDDRFAHADLEPPRRPFIGSLRRVRHAAIPAVAHSSAPGGDGAPGPSLSHAFSNPISSIFHLAMGHTIALDIARGAAAGTGAPTSDN